VQDWAAGLEVVHARIAGAFGRAEPRARVLAYLRGLLRQLERKNGWTLTDRGRRRGLSGRDAAAAAYRGLGGELLAGPRDQVFTCLRPDLRVG
jgi:hypothetical protein